MRPNGGASGDDTFVGWLGDGLVPITGGALRYELRILPVRCWPAVRCRAELDLLDGRMAALTEQRMAVRLELCERYGGGFRYAWGSRH